MLPPRVSMMAAVCTGAIRAAATRREIVVQLVSTSAFTTPVVAATPAARATPIADAPVVPLRSLRVGQRTVGSADAASIRFRFDGSGPASTRAIVPDNERARLLAASTAGPRVERALHRMASQIDAHAGHDNLASITFAPDVDAAAAAQVFSGVPTALVHTSMMPTDMRESMRPVAHGYREGTRAMDGVNGAINDHGNIVVMPAEARLFLASVGAYKPAPNEFVPAHRAAYRAAVPQMLRHEMEHSATPAAHYGSSPGLDGLEEGLAEALRTAQPAVAAAADDLPPVSQWGRTSKQSALATAGWKPYVRPTAKVLSQGAASNGVYAARQNVVADLLATAGVDRSTDTGYAAARELLQGRDISRVAGALADAIIAAHGLTPTVREPLRTAIRDITLSPSPDPVADLRSRFGLVSGSPNG